MRIGRIDKSRVSNKNQQRTIEYVSYDATNIDLSYEGPDVDMDDPKSVDRYVKAIKVKVRNSLEYKRLMTTIKDKMGGDTCYYVPNAKRGKGRKVKISMHHLAGTITDVIKIILMKRYACNEPITIQPIVKEVMEAHYLQMISLVPVCTTIHQLLHADDSPLFIPVQDATFGNSILFYKAYYDYMNDDYKSQYEKYFELSKAMSELELIIPDDISVNMIYYVDKATGLKLPDSVKLDELLAA